MLKEIGKQKIIMIAICVLALIVILVLLITDQYKSTSYYGQDYPVTVKSHKGGGLTITLDGSKTSDVPWELEETEVENPVITYSSKTNGAKITFTVTPSRMGYETIKVEKNRTINEIVYPVASIYLDIVVSETDDGLVAALAQASEKSLPGELGAADTTQPYYITGNYIYLPAEGDWELLDANTLDPEDTEIVLGVADNGSLYYRVNSLSSEQKDLIFKSESLGQEYKLKASYNENNLIVIEKAAD